MANARRSAALFAVLLFAYLMAIYPAVKEQNERKGFDARIIYEAGRGNVGYKVAIPARDGRLAGYAYSHKLLPVLKAWSALGWDRAFLVLHILNAAGLAALVAGAVRITDRHPRIGWGLAVVVGYLASDVIGSGNPNALLVGASLTPAGAAVVCCVKPWFGGPLLVLHAIGRTSNINNTLGGRASVVPDAEKLNSVRRGGGSDSGRMGETLNGGD